MDRHEKIRLTLTALGWRPIPPTPVLTWRMKAPEIETLEVALMSNKHPHAPGFAINDHWQATPSGEIVPTGDYGKTLADAARTSLASLCKQVMASAQDPSADMWMVARITKDALDEIPALRRLILMDYYLEGLEVEGET